MKNYGIKKVIGQTAVNAKLKIDETKFNPSKVFIFVQSIYEMNIQTRKLVLIEEFLRISDESLITKLESFLKQEKKISRERSLKPMSLNEFHDMIDQAKRDSEEGRVISHQDLKKKIKSWK